MSSLFDVPGATIFDPVSEGNVIKRCRAKYIPQEDGTLRLAMVQQFSFPIFRENGFEEIAPAAREISRLSDDSEAGDKLCEAYQRRATRRAKVAALDLILCNPDLDTFCTFTYSPDGNDRTSYDDVYRKLAVWCSNAVQRRGLKYVAVPEYHHDGEAIHFHMVCNRSGLRLKAAQHKGMLLKHSNGSQISNITDWIHGFSTAVDINAGKDDRDAVAKYIFKYMGKQEGQKIGGRYFLHGGKLRRPVYKLADSPEVFFDGESPRYHRDVDILDGAKYEEWTFV